MAEWVYEVYYGQNNNAGLPSTQSSVPMTIKRVSPASLPSGYDTSFYVLGSTDGTFESHVNVKTFSEQKISFGSYATSENLPVVRHWDSSAQKWVYDNHTIPSTTGITISSSILSVGTSAVSTSLTTNFGTGHGDSFWIYSSSGTKAFTIKVNVIEKYSASTFTATSVDFGTNSTVYISNSYLSELNHKVKWECSNSDTTGWITVAQNTGSASAQMQNSWMNAIPSNTSRNCTVYLETYKGDTKIGSTATQTISLTVPATVKPSFSSLTITSSYNQFNNQYLQNRSGVLLTVTGITTQYNSAIASISCTCNMSETIVTDTSAKTFTINPFRYYGTLTFSATITDQRGRTSDTVTQQITVLAYSPPTIVAASAYRCKANGIADEQGTYADIRVVTTYSDLTGNTLSISSQYYESLHPSTMYSGVNNMISGADYIIGNNTLQANLTYYVRFTITDTVGNTATKDVVVQTAAYAIHVRNGGSGVAFGKASEHDNAVDINDGWDLYYKGIQMLPIIYYVPTQAQPEPSTSFEGLIWLKPAT